MINKISFIYMLFFLTACSHKSMMDKHEIVKYYKCQETYRLGFYNHRIIFNKEININDLNKSFGYFKVSFLNEKFLRDKIPFKSEYFLTGIGIMGKNSYNKQGQLIEYSYTEPEDNHKVTYMPNKIITISKKNGVEDKIEDYYEGGKHIKTLYYRNNKLVRKDIFFYEKAYMKSFNSEGKLDKIYPISNHPTCL